MNKQTLISIEGLANDRKAAAPETLRRQSLLSGAGWRDPAALARANDAVAYSIEQTVCDVPSMHRNRDDGGHAEHYQLQDLEILRSGGKLGWKDWAAMLCVNASAGVGKSYAFLKSVSEQCTTHTHVTAAILSPDHRLSTQSFRAFEKICRKNLKVDASEFARVFIAVDEGCARTCARAKDRRPELQRKFAAKCGVPAKNFCHETKNEEGEIVNPGCPLVDVCDYWAQLKDTENIRVWFHTYAAAQKDSLRLAGIDIKFDRRCCDENLMALYKETEVIYLDHLPVSSEASWLNSIDNRGTETKEDRSKESAEVFAAIHKFMHSADDFNDGDASELDAAKLRIYRDSFEKLVQQTLRPSWNELAFDPNNEGVKDMRPRHKVQLHTLVRQREEAKAAWLACELLLSMHSDTERRGYDIDERNNCIKLHRRGGFSALSKEEYIQLWKNYERNLFTWSENKDLISEVRRKERPLSDLTERERDIIWEEEDEETGGMKLRWTNPKPQRPNFTYLGATLEYYDATLVPTVAVETIGREPDVQTCGWRSMQYMLVPARRDLVTVRQLRFNKLSRATLGLNEKNKKTKNEENGRYLEPTEQELAQHEAVKAIEQISTLIEYHRIRGDDPVAIVPKQLCPDHISSNAYISIFPKLSYGERSAYITHGSVAGQNGFENCGALFIVSQGFSENPRDYENMAIAITGRPVQRIGSQFESCDIEDYAKQGSETNYVPSSRPTHPDPLTEALRWMHMEGAQIQARARARDIRRGRPISGEMVGDDWQWDEPETSRPLTIYLLQRLILDDENVKWDTLRNMLPSPLDFLSAMGVFIEDRSQHGAREFANTLLPGIMRCTKDTWVKLVGGAAPESWQDAVIVLRPEGQRIQRVSISIDPDKRQELIDAGLEFEGYDAALLGVLEALQAKGEDWVTLADVATQWAAATGEEVPSSKIVRKVVEGLGMPERFEVRRKTAGNGVQIHPTEEATQ